MTTRSGARYKRKFDNDDSPIKQTQVSQKKDNKENNTTQQPKEVKISNQKKEQPKPTKKQDESSDDDDDDDDDDTEDEEDEESYNKQSVQNTQESLLRLRVKLLSQQAYVPVKISMRSAGFDLFSAEPRVLPAKSDIVVATDVVVTVPEGYCGYLLPHPELSSKRSIHIESHVIDSTQQDAIRVHLFNYGNEDVVIKVADRIAQLVLAKISTPIVSIVNST